MNGNIRHETVIDYTNVSRPLTVEHAYEDIQATLSKFAEGVDRFVMWEHQWDHMLKQADIEDTNESYIYSSNDRQLWGVRVELADPPKQPVAVLEVSSPLTDDEAEEIRERFSRIYSESVASLRAEQAKIVQKAREDRAASK